MAVEAIPAHVTVIEPRAIRQVCAVVRAVAIDAVIEKFALHTVIAVDAVATSHAIETIEAIFALDAVKTIMTIVRAIGIAHIVRILIVRAVGRMFGSGPAKAFVVGEKLIKRHGLMTSFFSKYAR